jgi:hypothetical protein
MISMLWVADETSLFAKHAGWNSPNARRKVRYRGHNGMAYDASLAFLKHLFVLILVPDERRLEQRLQHERHEQYTYSLRVHLVPWNGVECITCLRITV